ncbi:carbohydrate kinase family protein [Halobaculum sp. P14]|uniref:carbohydrate kinase family protein n=1 Tax=Halobaculum sp. P14 TaxID=3421638 RepID=UPI003EB8B670
MKLVVGECLVDLHPAREPAENSAESADAGEAVETGVGVGGAAAYRRRPGGAPANVAVGLARLGAPAALWTRVGDDGFGDFLAERLDAAGVPGRFVERDPDAPTGLAVVGRDADGDRRFSLYLDGTAATRLRPGGVDDALAAVSWLHVGGVDLAYEPARTAVFDLLERAPADATVSFDPNARPSLWTAFDYADTLDRALGLVDVVVASPEDVAPAGYGGDADSETALAAALTGAGPHTALVTRGGAGAVAVSTPEAPWGAATVEHAGFDADVVDTTGAGDAFTAGAIAALSAGRDVDAAVRFANAVGAAATTAEGAMTALPTRDEIDRLLDR